jgi:hypothetical protein
MNETRQLKRDALRTAAKHAVSARLNRERQKLSRRERRKLERESVTAFLKNDNHRQT